jgi:hypothetical protein
MQIERFSILIVLGAFTAIGRAAPEHSSPTPPRLPVLAWIGPPPAEATVARYRELADCGFTDSFSGFPNADAVAAALDRAQAAGIRLLISCPELDKEPRAVAQRFKNHPANGGYFLTDEPAGDRFKQLAELASEVRAGDGDHLIYINLLPDYATPQQLGFSTYAQYVDTFVRTVPVPLLSFDYYPIVGSAIRSSWYANLQAIADASARSGKPFWAFALSLKHFDYPAATAANLREQVYSDLAYGAQGIEYFTYWQPAGLGSDAPIDGAGRRTATYDRVKAMNVEIQALSPRFVGAKVIAVSHTGHDLPAGTTRFVPRAPVKLLQTQGMGAVVSFLSHGADRMLLVLNRDIAKPMPLRVEFDAGVAVAQVEKDGSSRPLKEPSLRVEVPEGDAVLFTWK